MRNLVSIHSVAAVFLFFLAACALDAEPEETDEAASEALETSAVLNNPVDAEIWPGAEEDIAPTAGCSIVEWCDEPGSFRVVCRRTGCSQGAAENECKREARSACGTACPLHIYTAGGSRKQLSCPPVVCGGNAIECGQRCCGASATFCSGTRCCTGACSPGCPC